MRFYGELAYHIIAALVPTLAVAMGAKVIEKHFILDKSIGGPDAGFSLDEKEFTEMVQNVRMAEKAMGKADYSLTESKIKSRVFSRSLYVVEDIKKGEIVTEKNVRSVRPGYGLHPKYFKEIINKKVNTNLHAGTPFILSYLVKE